MEKERWISTWWKKNKWVGALYFTIMFSFTIGIRVVDGDWYVASEFILFTTGFFALFFVFGSWLLRNWK